MQRRTGSYLNDASKKRHAGGDSYLTESLLVKHDAPAGGGWTFRHVPRGRPVLSPIDPRSNDTLTTRLVHSRAHHQVDHRKRAWEKKWSCYFKIFFMLSTFYTKSWFEIKSSQFFRNLLVSPVLKYWTNNSETPYPGAPFPPGWSHICFYIYNILYITPPHLEEHVYTWR